MQQAIEELEKARTHVRLAEERLWLKRKKVGHCGPYNGTRDAINSIEGATITLEAWQEKEE